MTASSAIPDANPRSNPNDQVAAIWSQVQSRVIDLAGGDPNNLQPDLSVEGVLGVLDEVQRDKKEADEKHAGVRSAFDGTLKLIDNVSELAAWGTHEVMPLSHLCFNAVSFVIRAWQGYESIFESLADLLGQCGQYFTRLEYYIKGGMDPKLSMVACQHLQLFVEICDRTIKLRGSKLRRLLVFSKMFFLNDNDISDLLTKMEGLVDKEGRLVTAQIFSFASETVTNTREALTIDRRMSSKMDVLMEDRFEQRQENDLKRRKDGILRVLAFDDNKLDRGTQEPEPYWQRTYQNYRKRIVQGTGQWVFTEPEFAAWDKAEPNTAPILAIEGMDGSGKSYLASTIIHNLRNRGSAESTGPRSLVGFYFFEGNFKEELKRTSHLDVLAKSLVWQFVQGDASYLKSVTRLSEEAKDLDPHEISSRLLFDNPDLPHINATFYIVIDGLSDVASDPLINFLQQASTKDRQFRVLLTGHPKVFEQLAATEGISFAKIPINSRNRSDVEMFTEQRMNDVDALRDDTRLGVPALRKKISESLCEKTAGDYFQINTILKHINTLEYVNDIDNVLEDAGQERSQQILGEIEKLNTIRSPKEIAEINEIILWIFYGREWLKPRQMSAVLYLRTGEISLMPLETKLQVKYTLFEVDGDGDIDFRSLEIGELIPERGRHLGDNDSQKTSKRINQTEVTMVRHYLNTVCPPEVYEKFDFETYFDQSLNHRGGEICRDDKESSEVKLAVTCLQILTEARDGRRELLRPYAVRYFLNHLSSVDLAFADRELKAAVGPRLLKLFTDEAAIDSLLWPDSAEKATSFGSKTRSTWLDGDDGVHEVLRWFRDSAVISDVSEQADRAWIASVTSSMHPVEELLKPLAKRMAVHWLREPSELVLARVAFSFVLGYVNKVDGGKGKQETSNSLDEPAVERIQQVEDWSQDLLQVESKDALWEVQMAIIFEEFTFKSEAEKRCRDALELDPSYWRASYYLARVVSSNTDAIQILQSVTGQLESNEELVKDASNKTALSEMLFELGHKYWQEGQQDSATHAYTKSLETHFSGYDRVLTIMEQYRDSDRWNDILALVELVETSPQMDVSDMLIQLATGESIHDIILQTTLQTGQASLLDKIYEDAIHAATNTQAYTSLYHIRYRYASALYQNPTTEDRAISLWESALKDDLPHSALDVESTLSSLIVKLAPIYLRKARAAEPGSETAKTYLDKISAILPQGTAESNIVFPAKLYLTRYYHVMGDQIRAKQVARSVVQMALEILSDDDDDNDYLAYWRLLLVFLPLGDDVNTLAAVAMASLSNETPFEENNNTTTTTSSDKEKEAEAPGKEGEEVQQQATKPKELPQTEKTTTTTSNDNSNSNNNNTPTKEPPTPSTSSSSSSSTTSTSPSTSPSIFALCDGQCGHCWTTPSEIYWCKDCINITFDPICYRKLKKGWLPQNVCNKDHEFLFIPRWDGEKMGRVARGGVPYGEKMVSVEEWKKEVGRVYVDFEGERGS